MRDIRTDRAIELYKLARGWVARGYLAPAEELRDLLDGMDHDVCGTCYDAETYGGGEECAGCLDGAVERVAPSLVPEACVRCSGAADGADPYCVRCGLEMSKEVRHAS